MEFVNIGKYFNSKYSMLNRFKQNPIVSLLCFSISHNVRYISIMWFMKYYPTKHKSSDSDYLFTIIYTSISVLTILF